MLGTHHYDGEKFLYLKFLLTELNESATSKTFSDFFSGAKSATYFHQSLTVYADNGRSLNFRHPANIGLAGDFARAIGKIDAQNSRLLSPDEALQLISAFR